MDTSDGIAAGKGKCLMAMRDSTIGASGIISILIVILIQVGSLIQLKIYAPTILMISSFFGRFSPLIAINNYNYLHSQGLGLLHKQNWEGIRKESIPTLIFFLIIMAMILLALEPTIKLKIFYCFILSFLSSYITPIILGKKLDGHSGDSYGASVVITETAALLLSALILS